MRGDQGKAQRVIYSLVSLNTRDGITEVIRSVSSESAYHYSVQYSQYTVIFSPSIYPATSSDHATSTLRNSLLR